MAVRAHRGVQDRDMIPTRSHCPVRRQARHDDEQRRCTPIIDQSGGGREHNTRGAKLMIGVYRNLGSGGRELSAVSRKLRLRRGRATPKTSRECRVSNRRATRHDAGLLIHLDRVEPLIRKRNEQRDAPDASIGHVRICAGGGPKGPPLPRPSCLSRLASTRFKLLGVAPPEERCASAHDQPEEMGGDGTSDPASVPRKWVESGATQKMIRTRD